MRKFGHSLDNKRSNMLSRFGGSKGTFVLGGLGSLIVAISLHDVLGGEKLMNM